MRQLRRRLAWDLRRSLKIYGGRRRRSWGYPFTESERWARWKLETTIRKSGCDIATIKYPYSLVARLLVGEHQYVWHGNGMMVCGTCE